MRQYSAGGVTTNLGSGQSRPTPWHYRPDVLNIDFVDDPLAPQDLKKCLINGHVLAELQMIVA